ncbi:MAG: transporter substrate-binding domain-containing protein, partial [Hyphomicrobiales bacterium]|nr:transporter substrate-binding domain-containing protein [Hyphomicrobiales bacterium]
MQSRPSVIDALAALIALSITLFAMTAVGPAQAETAPMALPTFAQRTGDLDVMLKRRLVRILVPFSKTQYFVDKDQSYGIAADLGRELQAELNKRYSRSKVFQITVAFVPARRDKLIDDLAAGRGDIAAGALTITPERAGEVDFVDPWLTDVKEVLVTGPDAPALMKLDDLAGKEIRVRKSSSYFTHLGALSDAFKARGLAPL